MPYIELKTNIALTHEKEDFLKSKIADVLASSFPGKTENWLMVRFDRRSEMYFGGSEAPCMMIDVSIFGKQDKSGYDKMTAAACELIEKECGHPLRQSLHQVHRIRQMGLERQQFLIAQFLIVEFLIAVIFNCRIFN